MQIFWIGILFLIVAGVGVSFFAKPVSGQLDDFAQCLTDKEAVFYGAFWCPHCQAQKRMFGNSVKLLPYVECSTPDGQSQLQICVDKKIQQYPTWEFADESRLTGEVPLLQLAEKTGCVLPQE
ncbi:MAG: hypothetical protein UY39_C0021G0004 [Candidatus Kaiserbacteria bacterium GW2011_GWC2_49_12]|uniref:VKORC1/thioredoxin domain protein n=3 Tax=Candidatus Kaiseribacteriota TaxID=1752734 RepID=A0A0G1YQR8_9BACT|nr:MAG: hypothetical protein UY39_C0021G0004 [Candidatus Kaiserbacteria bacterium GW2011_GWC2_49_12]KKW17357.1 MAG: hypothetical protein UY57_C0018G0009 [Candidatus Kaiserbacteria bacterium GW2011_GWB1_50_17]KKW18136.1 MAG: hypothetical protein UY59_C0015G0006 [Candidatus Kaiserbacteria bacterium GW2011_GWA1_50_28]